MSYLSIKYKLVDGRQISRKYKIHTNARVKSGNFGHQVNSDKHLQTVEILMSRLIRILTVCFVNLFFIPKIKI